MIKVESRRTINPERREPTATSGNDRARLERTSFVDAMAPAAPDFNLHELSGEQQARLLATYREMSERLAESFPAGGVDNLFLPAINRLSFGR